MKQVLKYGLIVSFFTLSTAVMHLFGQSLLNDVNKAESKSNRIFSLLGEPPMSDEELNDKIDFQYCPNFHATDLKGGTHELMDFQGQVVILHFWKTYSKNGLMDMDFLSALQATNKDQIKVIAFSNYDHGEISPYFERKGYQTDLTIIPNGFQLPNRLIEEYGLCSPECTIILDADGRFRRIIQARGHSGTTLYHNKILQALESAFGV